MKIVADESVDRQVVDRLRSDGHDVVYVAELMPGVDDEVVLQRSIESDALLITADKDFGELVFRLGRVHTGVVLFRLAGLTTNEKSELVATVFERYGEELALAFSVVTERAVRIRKREG